MPWHLLDGVPLPDQLAGDVALEFCNTRAGWGSAAPREYLVSARALVLWGADVGLHPLPQPVAGPPADLPVGPADPALARALDLREALYRCAVGTADTASWRRVGEAATRARRHATLRPPGPGQPARWQLDPADDQDPSLTREPLTGDALDRGAVRVLHAVALAADALLTSPLALAVSACPGPGCGWLFVDPRRRRRWCSMSVCGNRAKARRHRAGPGWTDAG